MKRCPTCNRTFTDEHLSFCIDDGTPLVMVQGDDDEELTQVGSGYESKSPPPYQPPSYVPPGGGEQRRSWPWVVGILGVLILALVGFTIAAAVLVPKLLRKSQEQVSVGNSNSNSAENSNSSLNSNSATPENSNVPANSNVSSNTLTPPPTDKDVVMAQLRNLEHEWTVANINADKKKLAEILADDYSSDRGDGKMQGKADYIRTIQRDTVTQRWEFRDLKLTLRGDRATLMGKVSFQLKDGEALYNFIDRFVWRDGRWQATGSEVTRIDNQQ